MKVIGTPEGGDTKKRGCGFKLLIAFLIILAFGVGDSVVNNMRDHGYLPTPTVRPTPTIPPTPAPTATFEQLKVLAVTVPYRKLLRDAEDYKGTWVHYRGKVISAQVKRNVYGQNYHRLRVYVTLGQNGLWSDRVTLTYWEPPVRVLEGDIIELIGAVDGRLSFFGDTGMPAITVISLRIEPEGE